MYAIRQGETMSIPQPSKKKAKQKDTYAHRMKIRDESRKTVSLKDERKKKLKPIILNTREDKAGKKVCQRGWPNMYQSYYWNR